MVTTGAAKTQAIGWLLCDLASPLSKRPIAEITPAEILIIIKKMEKLGQRETARRLRATIGRVFRLAVAILRALSDPTYSLKGALAAPCRRADEPRRRRGPLRVFTPLSRCPRRGPVPPRLRKDCGIAANDIEDRIRPSVAHNCPILRRKQKANPAPLALNRLWRP